MTEITLENRLAVHELIAKYSHHVDNYRADEWASLFLDDGEMVGIPQPLVGRQAFIGQCEKLKQGPTEYRHSITNIYLEADSTNDHAVAHAYGLVSDWAATPPLLSIFVEYRFDVVKLDEGWKIAELAIHPPYGI